MTHLTPPPFDLTQSLGLDVGAMDSAHRRARSQAVRDRFLAGVTDALQKHSPEGTLWLDVSANNSTHWLRMDLLPAEHDRKMKEAATSSGTKAFFRALGTTRSAISSTSRDSRDAMGFLWVGEAVAIDPSVLHEACLHLLHNPSQKLTQELLASLRAQQLDETIALHHPRSRSLPRL